MTTQSTTTKEALEPCPLAHEVREGVNLWSSSAGQKWHIWCYDCGLQFEGRLNQPKDEVIKAWNSRSAPIAPVVDHDAFVRAVAVLPCARVDGDQCCFFEKGVANYCASCQAREMLECPAPAATVAPVEQSIDPIGDFVESVWKLTNDRDGWSRSILRGLAENLARQFAPASPAAIRDEAGTTFQNRVQPWMMACFGAEIAGDKEERNHRFLEEALELVQACGAARSEAHQLVDYTFDRPVGNAQQEVGGVMVTLAALCLARGFDMHECGEVELTRIWGKVDVIRAKQAAKPKHSPLPERVATTPPSTAAKQIVEEWMAEVSGSGYIFNSPMHRKSLIQRIERCLSTEREDQPKGSN